MINVCQIIDDGEGRCRVVFYQNPHGSFGFREEHWSDDPMANSWVPYFWPDSHCNTLERAVAEATSRIDWLRRLNSRENE
jgi:hypothetical protein